jgi:hypothetical protein
VAVSCFMCVAVEMRCDCTLDAKPGGSRFFELVPRACNGACVSADSVRIEKVCRPCRGGGVL